MTLSRNQYVWLLRLVNVEDKDNPDIEGRFEKGNEAGVVLVNLAAADDTVWHPGPELETAGPNWKSDSGIPTLYSKMYWS